MPPKPAWTNVDDFNRQVSLAVKDMTEKQFLAFHKKVALEALRRVVMSTPVDTGHLRANWQVSIGNPSDAVNDFRMENEAGGVGVGSEGAAPAAALALGDGSAKIATVPLFGVVWLNNAVDYAEKIEFGQFKPPSPGPSRDPRPGRTGKILVEGGFVTQSPKRQVRLVFEQLLTMFGPLGNLGPGAIPTKGSVGGSTP